MYVRTTDTCVYASQCYFEFTGEGQNKGAAASYAFPHCSGVSEGYPFFYIYLCLKKIYVL